MTTDKINLLIVDDEQQFLTAISKSLGVRGFNVIAVNRGETAIETARQHPIDIALVDLKMPGLDGEKTLRRLKEENEWMEIIILTGHGTVESAVELSKIGAYSYLQKPCELERLLEELKSAYQKRVSNESQVPGERKGESKVRPDSSPRQGILSRLRKNKE